MNGISINVFEDNSRFDKAIVCVEVRDIPMDWKVNELLSYVDKELVKLIGEEYTAELFENDFNQSCWYNEKTKNFVLDILLFSTDSRKLLDELNKVSKRKEWKREE